MGTVDSVIMEGEMTEDAMENDRSMTQHVEWDTSTKGSEAEWILRRKLRAIFLRQCGKEEYLMWHTIMKNYIVENGIGSIYGMGYETFCVWMGGRCRENTKANILPGTMKGMQNFVKNYGKD